MGWFGFGGGVLLVGLLCTFYLPEAYSKDPEKGTSDLELSEEGNCAQGLPRITLPEAQPPRIKSDIEWYLNEAGKYRVKSKQESRDHFIQMEKLELELVNLLLLTKWGKARWKLAINEVLNPSARVKLGWLTYRSIKQSELAKEMEALETGQLDLLRLQSLKLRRLFFYSHFLDPLDDLLKDSKPEELQALAPHRMDIETRWSHLLQLRADILNSNLRLVLALMKNLRLTKKYKRHFMVLIDAGNDGLLNAVNRFEVNRGFCFTTYSSRAIHRNLMKTITSLRTRRRMSSLDAPRPGTDDLTLLDSVHDSADPKSRAFEVSVQDRALLKDLVQKLSPRQIFIIEARYGLRPDGIPQSLEDTSRLLATHEKLPQPLTKERIRQIEIKALAQLKKYAARQYPDQADEIRSARRLRNRIETKRTEDTN